MGLAIAIVCIALLPAGAQASELTLTPRNQQARPGQMLKLRLTADAAQTCRLSVDGRRLQVTTSGAGRFAISGRVSRRARPGGHALSLRCTTGRLSTRARVARRASNRKARGGLLRGRISISAVQSEPIVDAPATAATTLTPSTAPFPRPILSASPQAQQWWQNYGNMVVTSFRNGQCTDWAQRRRPDIVQNGYMRRYDRVGPDQVITSWDAKYWTQHAVEAGMAVSHTPVVGAIMVTAAGSNGAGTAGHVAVVETVASDGSFAITQMHAPNVGEVTWQHYSASKAASVAGDSGIAFIR
ncbi:MAG: CHAP domain-containing protein [Solirubrobacteraceae bacterium]